jgi:hypothetical protein
MNEIIGLDNLSAYQIQKAYSVKCNNLVSMQTNIEEIDRERLLKHVE